MDKYAVFGNPIGHSKSPLIHAAFARQTGQSLSYEKVLAEPGQFEHAARAFLEHGGMGFNVTVPFKEDAYRWVDELNPLAERAGAVNTIHFTGEKTIGYNTDGLGLMHDISHNHGINLRDKNILLLGAGGAVRGVLEPLLLKHPTSITIANRTVSKAQTLADLFDPFGHVVACDFKQLSGQQYDLIINGTSTGLSGAIPAIPDDCLRPGGTTYDMMYSSEPTAFVRWGQQQGASQALDGLGMLIEQAAEAFAIWRGVRPDTSDLIQQLRKR